MANQAHQEQFTRYEIQTQHNFNQIDMHSQQRYQHNYDLIKNDMRLQNNFNTNFSSSSCTSSSSSSSTTSLLMPLLHESTDLLNCDLSLTQLQQMDDDEDYVEHDLGDTDEESESDEDEDDDESGSEEDSEAGNDDSEDNVTGNYQNNEKSKKRKANKQSRKSSKLKDKDNSILKIDNSNQQISNGLSNSFENLNNPNKINENNFVTITRKDEATSQLQSG